MQCKLCGSYAINHGAHGRQAGVDLDLCDVCYWQKRPDTPTIYIAGPMSGIVDHNYPAFHAAARFLRNEGWLVSNPAEICEVGTSWSCCMRKDIAELVKCDAVYMLPGWKESKGATLELHVAERLGMTVIFERVNL